MTRTKEQEDARNEMMDLDGKAAIASHKLYIAAQEGRPREELQKLEEEVLRWAREAKKAEARAKMLEAE